LFELQNVEGPCLDAFRTGAVVESGDLRADQNRWPTFAPHAVEVGYLAVHSIPLRLRERIIGALNLLRAEAGTVTSADANVLRALADIATVGVLQERTITGLGSAKGVLAERLNLSVDEAFESLRSYARRHGLRLTDVALGIVNRTLSIPFPQEPAQQPTSD
jgi:GAF domain-containing protein